MVMVGYYQKDMDAMKQLIQSELDRVSNRLGYAQEFNVDDLTLDGNGLAAVKLQWHVGSKKIHLCIGENTTLSADGVLGKVHGAIGTFVQSINEACEAAMLKKRTRAEMLQEIGATTRPAVCADEAEASSARAKKAKFKRIPG